MDQSVYIDVLERRVRTWMIATGVVVVASLLLACAAMGIALTHASPA